MDWRGLGSVLFAVSAVDTVVYLLLDMLYVL